MRRRFLITITASDVIALGAAFVVSAQVIFDTPLFWRAPSCAVESLAAIECVPVGESVLPMVAFMAAGALLASWVSLRLWASGIPRPTYGRAVGIVSLSVVFTALGLLFTRSYFSRGFLLSTTALWLVGTLAHRAVRRRRPWTDSMVVVTGEKGLVDDLRRSPHAGVTQVFDPAGSAPGEPLQEGSSLVLDLRAVLSDRMAQFVSSCNLAGFPVRALASVYEAHTGRIALVHLTEGWEISAPLSRAAGYAPIKRALDVLLVLATAPLWIILGLVIFVAVRVDSPGPAIYRQRRVGFKGEPFTLYKFRTMVNGADADGPRFARIDDERLTRTGRLLRRFRADEIPQLWNVLRGDLSLVGPRPEQIEFVEQFEESIPFYGYRHLVRPGVTGWAQVNYGYADDEAETIEKLTFDLYYVKHMSLWLDLRILSQSLWTVLSGFGAQ